MLVFQTNLSVTYDSTSTEVHISEKSFSILHIHTYELNLPNIHFSKHPSCGHSLFFLYLLFRMHLQTMIDRLRDQADLHTPLPSAFSNRRQSRQDKMIESVLRFLIRILLIIDSNQPLEEKIKEILAIINFFYVTS